MIKEAATPESGGDVKLEEFRKLVKAQFGENLEHATPANVREFVDRFEEEILQHKSGNRIVLTEKCKSYEEILKDFFAKTLELPPEEAVAALWPLALDLAFATIESQYSDRFASLFQDTD
ncbi:MAG: hypothetical protein N3B12_03625 [Armatimonadetes bacterium]|nr:hypothetical protein [Armatimonadota bacterium]